MSNFYKALLRTSRRGWKCSYSPTFEPRLNDKQRFQKNVHTTGFESKVQHEGAARLGTEKPDPTAKHKEPATEEQHRTAETALPRCRFGRPAAHPARAVQPSIPAAARTTPVTAQKEEGVCRRTRKPRQTVRGPRCRKRRRTADLRAVAHTHAERRNRRQKTDSQTFGARRARQTERSRRTY